MPPKNPVISKICIETPEGYEEMNNAAPVDLTPDNDDVLRSKLMDLMCFMVDRKIDSAHLTSSSGLRMDVQLDYREVIKNIEHQILYGDTNERGKDQV